LYSGAAGEAAGLSITYQKIFARIKKYLTESISFMGCIFSTLHAYKNHAQYERGQ